MQSLLEWMLQHFYELQIGAGFALIILFWWFKRPSDQSQFKSREADSKSQSWKSYHPKKPGRLAEATVGKNTQKKDSPLQIEGLVLDGKSHELLGIAASATIDEIQSAYREKMKRYHPDRVGRPGSREWQDAQVIAIKLGEAKEAMLKGRGKK